MMEILNYRNHLTWSKLKLLINIFVYHFSTIDKMLVCTSYLLAYERNGLVYDGWCSGDISPWIWKLSGSGSKSLRLFSICINTSLISREFSEKR